MHEQKESNLNSRFYRRLAYDEILSNLLVLSQVRKRIKKLKKRKKIFSGFLEKKIITNFLSNLKNLLSISIPRNSTCKKRNTAEAIPKKTKSCIKKKKRCATGFTI